MKRRMWVMTPTYRPVGGVVKIFDYVRHALDLGIEAVIACPDGPDRDSALWRIEAFRPLLEHPGVRLLADGRIAPAGDDLVFYSWPDHWDLIAPRLPDGFPLGRVVHIIQNTRHANPHFLGGRALRTLARPMTRIVINDQVLHAITPFLNHEVTTRVIPLGHRADFFRHRREPGLPRPVTVGYTTWKSDLGDRVAARLADDARLRFRAIRGPVDWGELRSLYVAADVFLCTPTRQEGFYLPGLEAMAADSLVLTPDVGGNLAYCSFGQNCVQVPFEDDAAYAACLVDLLHWAPAQVAALRAAGRETAASHTIEREAAAFAELIRDIDAQPGPAVVRPARWRPANLAGLPENDSASLPPAPARPRSPQAGDAAMQLDEVQNVFTEHWRPGWGSVAADEVMYMQEVIRAERPRHFLEVGMASGLSAGLLARILEGNGAETLTTIDHDNTFFGDTSKENGFLIEAIYPGGTVTVNKLPFTTSCDIPRLGMRFEMAFIDANHQHPWPLIDTLCLYPYMTGPRTVFHHDLRLFRIQDVLLGIGPKYLYDQFPEHLRTRSTANHGNLFVLRMPEQRVEMEEIAADGFSLPWSLRNPLSPAQAGRIRAGLAEHYSPGLVEVFDTCLKRFNTVDRLRLGV